MPHSTAAVARLRIAARTVMQSLTPAVQKTLASVRVRLADLGYAAEGHKILGAARGDGEVVLLDREAFEQFSDGRIEEVLAHELGHAYRARRGEDDDDDRREEIGTRQLVRSWGFRGTKEHEYRN